MEKDTKYIIKRVIIGVLIALILSFMHSCTVHAATVEGCIDSGDSLKGIAKIGSNYVGSGYYEWAPKTWNNQNLNVSFCTDLKDHSTQTGKQTLNFTVDYCVNGSQPNFAIYSSYYNDIDYTYFLNTSIYLAEGEWSKAYCYRSFIKLRLNYSDNVGTGNYNFTEYTQDNNVFALYGYENYNKLARYNDLVYYNANDYNTALEQAKIYGQNNSIIQGQQDIINNQTNNTNSIINNQTNNTNSIINNQNNNTQDIIDNNNENFLSCKNTQYIPNDDDYSEYHKTLKDDGTLRDDSNFNVTEYINIKSNSSYTLSSIAIGWLWSYCLYDDNKSLISCSNYNNQTSITFNSSTASFIRYSYRIGRSIPTLSGIICKNRMDETTDSINDLNNNINDDNVSGAESEIDDLLDNASFDDNSGIQSIITAPLNFINGLTNSCSPISLTIPYIDTNVTIPCIKQELTNRVPTLVPILSTVINGFVIYRILIDIVAIVKSAREPDEDRIEVLDL